MFDLIYILFNYFILDGCVRVSLTVHETGDSNRVFSIQPGRERERERESVSVSRVCVCVCVCACVSTSDFLDIYTYIYTHTYIFMI